MSKGIKIIVWMVSVVLILAALAIVAIRLSFPAEKVRGLIADSIERSLNRNVTLGKSTVTIWGGIGVTLSDLKVQNLPGFGDEDFLTVRRLEVTVKFWPLLSGKFEFKKIALDSLILNLKRNETGSVNFKELGTTAPTGTQPSAEAISAPVIFDRLEIRNSRLNYHDDSLGYAVTVLGFAGKMGLLKNAFDQTLFSEGDFQCDSFSFRDSAQQLSFPDARLAAEVKMRLNFKQDRLEIEKIRVHLGELEGLADGTISSLGTSPNFELNFRTKRFTPGQFLSLLPRERPAALKSLKGQGEIVASARLQGRPAVPGNLEFSGKLSLENIILNFAGIEGDFAVKSGVVSFNQKALDLLFEDCSFEGEPFALKLYAKDMFNPQINASIEVSINLKAFRNYSRQLQNLSGRLNANLDIYTDLKRPELTRIEGGMILEDLEMTHALLNQPIKEADFICRFNKTDVVVEVLEGEIGASKFKMHSTLSRIIPFLAAAKCDTVHADIDFRLDAPSLNVDELASLIPLDDYPSFPSQLSRITIKGELGIEQGLVDGMTFSGFRGIVDFRDRVLHVDQITMGLFGGTVEGEAIVDYEDIKKPKLQVELAANNVEIDSLLSQFTPCDSVLYGKAAITASISTFLGRPQEIMGAVVASGKVQIDDGYIRNFPLLKAIANKIGLDAGDEEKFGNLQNSFRIQNGMIAFDDLTMNLGEAQWDISGKAGLDGTLDYDVECLIDRRAAGSSQVLSTLDSLLGSGQGKVIIPIRLTGTYQNPVFEVDRAKLLDSADKRIKEKGWKLFQGLIK